MSNEKVKKKRISTEAYDRNKQTVYIVPKSKIKSRVHYTPEPAQGLQQLTVFLLCVLQDSPIHRHLFWVAVSVLQLDEVSLYAAGLALIEQNLHMLDSMNLFENQARLSERNVASAFCCHLMSIHCMTHVAEGCLLVTLTYH